MSKDIEQKPCKICDAMNIRRGFKPEHRAYACKRHSKKTSITKVTYYSKEHMEQYANERVIAELEQLLTREWSIDANDLRRYIIERQATLRGGTTNE